MTATALITGASSGLGAEFARQLAARGADVVLVARDQAALDALAADIRRTHGVAAEVLVADLVEEAQRERVEARLADADRPVDVLVNNAGYGLPLAFETNDIEDEARHLALHVEVPMRLMRAALPGMLERGSGKVINVASVAGLMPRGTYGAVKSWVISFSRWANVRYGEQGVTITAVCPGFTHTNFHERLGLPPGEEGISRWMWLDKTFVVRAGLRAAARGWSVSVPSIRYRALVALSRILPDRIVIAAASKGR
ncbi:SDR family NAD(P)-dependent oxidoreductase [Microbacterium sp.]|uniref:SDR family NAD(P)-dependent oxidoreductase n=1 Tax=Microbacterium sp. TaxID=51671 RepID=UPI0037369821